MKKNYQKIHLSVSTASYCCDLKIKSRSLKNCIHEQVKINKDYHHAKFDIDDSYSVSANANIKVLDMVGRPNTHHCIDSHFFM